MTNTMLDIEYADSTVYNVNNSTCQHQNEKKLLQQHTRRPNLSQSVSRIISHNHIII